MTPFLLLFIPLMPIINFMRQPFLLYKRLLKSKKYAYYVKIWDESSYDYSIRKSIAQIKMDLGPKAAKISHTSKAGADALVRMWLEDGIPNANKDLLSEYLLGFWDSDSDYVQQKKLRGQKISPAYVQNNFRGIKNHFNPFMKSIGKQNLLLSQVSASLLESFLIYKSQEGKVSSRTINAALQAVTVALSEAERLGLIRENPGRRVHKLSEAKSKREIFTPEEAKEFLDICLKHEDSRYYTINLLAASTGMRLGECLGLQHDDVKDGFIDICHNWQNNEGVKAPKLDSFRTVPVPEKTLSALRGLSEKNPHGNPFVFYGTEHDRPMSKDLVAVHFRKIVCSLENIDDKTRKARGLTFHSWRHYFNSMLRGKVSDHALRALTGHHDEKMTDRYSAVTEEQKNAVAKLADKLF